jgi:hypothetical protein
MRIRLLGTLTAIAVIGLALQASAQQPAPRAPRAHGVTPAHQQTPFTAEFKITRVQTLANGATITRESTEVRALDTEGRELTSTTTMNPSGDEHTFAAAYDPVAGTRTTWDSARQLATVTPNAAPVSCPAANATQIPRAPSPQRQAASVDLGIETIGGVEAHGHRTTITTPAGMIGNSEPLVETHETWQANSIGPRVLILRAIDDSPQSGHTTRELTNLTLSDPPLSTFQPPEGYETVNKDAPTPNCPAVQAAPVTSPAAQ